MLTINSKTIATNGVRYLQQGMREAQITMPDLVSASALSSTGGRRSCSTMPEAFAEMFTTFNTGATAASTDYTSRQQKPTITGAIIFDDTLAKPVSIPISIKTTPGHQCGQSVHARQRCIWR